MPSKAAKHLAARRRKKARKSASKRGRTGRRVLVWVGMLVLLGIAGTLLVTLPLRWIDPPTSSIMIQRGAEARRESGPRPRYSWRRWEEISPHLAVAVLAAEDQKFPDHFGLDFDSILDAWGERTARRRGASTISQQVAKNLYLWPGRSLVRKAIEAYLAIAIETLWPKQRILEIYLNIAEFGPNVFGAGVASRVHFGKSAARLSRHEAALLAAVLPNPRRLSASAPSDYVKERAEAIALEARRLGGVGFLRKL